MNLYYLHFNNYYNRIVKKFDTLAEYLTLPYYDNVLTANIAFNPNDGVDTKQVANVPVGNEFTYDYCVLAEGNDIVSRWFIIDANRNRNGQYTLTLRRDMFADSYEPVLDAPAFIEKATLNPNDPFIFNKEDMTVNQIKQSEDLLKDTTGCPWIVGYLENGTSMETKRTVTLSAPEVYGNLDSLETYYSSIKSNLGNFAVISNNNFKHRMNAKLYGNSTNYAIIDMESGSYSTPSGSTQSNTYLDKDRLSEYSRNFKSAYIDNKQAIIDTTNNYIGNVVFTGEGTAYDEFLKFNGKTIVDETTNKYYKVTINIETISSNQYYAVTGGNLFNTLTDVVHVDYPGLSTNEYTFEVLFYGQKITYSLEEIVIESFEYQFINSDINKLSDAPYLMFAIPYGAVSFMIETTTNITPTEAESQSISMALARDIIEQFSGDNGNLYDIQLLPYCPLINNIVDGEVILTSSLSYTKVFKVGETYPTTLICWATKSRFEFNIPYQIQVDDVKLSNQCDFCRISSPNWNGQFEFSPAKNGGVINFNVDCEYKPVQPYIHINPNFGRLYGQDFNDARGLICSGDFSLTQISNAWATYQRQNVNYQKTFDRQIQNMEVNNAIQNIQTVTHATLGAVGGALGGFMAGGPFGAMIGGATSATAGMVDYALQRAGQAEAIDYTKDQFGYNLGNIKALPDSLTKVSAFNNNNKLFPVLEFYSCTDEEKEAFLNKIKYNGMTVMRVGTIREFLQETRSYIKGKLIRVENILEDFHYVNELANEFNKGVFI